jgi:ribose-phosphate pyrophosphokinase
MKVFFNDSAAHLKRFFLHTRFQIGKYQRYVFSDGEIGIRLLEDVEGKPTAIIASILPDPRSFFELLVTHRVLRENRAAAITLVLPYFGYARQDRATRKGEGSIGIMVAELVQLMRPARVMIADLHSELIRNAFGRSLIEISAAQIFAEQLAQDSPQVIVSPDAGSKKRAETLAKLFDPQPEIVTIVKRRPRHNVAIAKELFGEVHGKDALIVDDMIDTGGTISEAVQLLSERGAHRIHVAATHGIFSDGAKDRLYRLPIQKILVTNTLRQAPYPKIKILNIAPLFLEEMKMASGKSH